MISASGRVVEPPVAPVLRRERRGGARGSRSCARTGRGPRGSPRSRRPWRTPDRRSRGIPATRLMAPCSLARRVISVKIVVPKPASFEESAGRIGADDNGSVVPAPLISSRRHATDQDPLPHRDHRLRPRRLDRRALRLARRALSGRLRGAAARRPAHDHDRGRELPGLQGRHPGTRAHGGLPRAGQALRHRGRARHGHRRRLRPAALPPAPRRRRHRSPPTPSSSPPAPRRSSSASSPRRVSWATACRPAPPATASSSRARRSSSWAAATPRWRRRTS